MAHDVFISYASEDKVVADAVCAALEADHIRCYIAPRDVLPGQSYAHALLDAIHAAGVFVLVFSAASNASNHVEHEVDRAVSCGLPILPLRVEDVMPCGSLEFYLAGQHWLDALTPPLADHLARLSVAITVLLQPPAKGARSLLKDDWRKSRPEAAKPSPAERPVHEPALAVTPAAPVAEKPPEAVKPPVAAPPVVPPPVVPPPVAEKPPEAVRPPVAAPPVVPPPVVPPPVTERPPEAVTPPVVPMPVVPPPVTRTPPKAAKLPAAPRPAPAAPPPASVTAPKQITKVKHAARPGRRPALIAAAVVGASWLVVLIAVELLVR